MSIQNQLIKELESNIRLLKDLIETSTNADQIACWIKAIKHKNKVLDRAKAQKVG